MKNSYLVRYFLQLVRTLEGTLFPIVYCYNNRILKEIILLLKCKLSKRKKIYKTISDSENEDKIEIKKYYSFDPTDIQISSCETIFTN